jgi:hypothetical protein
MERRARRKETKDGSALTARHAVDDMWTLDLTRPSTLGGKVLVNEGARPLDTERAAAYLLGGSRTAGLSAAAEGLDAERDRARPAIG